MPYVFVFSKVKHAFLLYTKKGKAKKKKKHQLKTLFFSIRVPYLEVHLNYGGAVRILKDIL